MPPRLPNLSKSVFSGAGAGVEGGSLSHSAKARLGRRPLHHIRASHGRCGSRAAAAREGTLAGASGQARGAAPEAVLCGVRRAARGSQGFVPAEALRKVSGSGRAKRELNPGGAHGGAGRAAGAGRARRGGAAWKGGRPEHLLQPELSAASAARAAAVHGPDGRRAARTRSSASGLSGPRRAATGSSAWAWLADLLHGSDVSAAGCSRGAAGALLLADRHVSHRGRPWHQEGEDAREGGPPWARAFHGCLVLRGVNSPRVGRGVTSRDPPLSSLVGRGLGEAPCLSTSDPGSASLRASRGGFTRQPE